MMPRTTRNSTWFYAALPAALTAFLFSCSSGSSGGGGPPAVVYEVEVNDAFDDADVQALTHGQAGSGSLATETDVDFWSMQLNENDVISVELFGTRLAQSAWDTGDSIPRITIYDTDGTTVLVHHDYPLWSWGKHDLDHPMLLVPATGTYYASVMVDGLAVVDGDYCIRSNRLNVGSLQMETGDAGAGDNDTFGNAEPIVPGTVYGFHDDDNDDYFSFDVNSASVVRFELTSYRNGIIASDDDYFDTELVLYDQNGTDVLANNDDSYFYDSAINFLIDAPGTYFLDVTECCGAGDAPYFLTYSRSTAGGGVENEPNEDPDTADSVSYGGAISGFAVVGDVDGFKFSGTRGDMVRVQLFDITNSLAKTDVVFATLYGPDGITTLDTGGDDNLRTMTTILQESGTHYIVVESAGLADTDYRVELTKFKSASYESEPNDVLNNADALGSGGRSAGVIEIPPVPGGVIDSDVFKFSVSANRLTTISIYASNDAVSSDGFFNFSGHGSDLEPTLTILDADANVIATSPSDWLFVDTEDVMNGLPCAAVSFVPSSGGTYYVVVTDTFGGSASDFYYVIERTD